MSEVINLTPLVQQQSTSRLKFVEKYWFSNLQMITVRNPLAGDVVFMHEMRNYAVKQGSESRLPGSIANLYLDLVARTIAQDKDDLGAIADPIRCGKYYDELIVNVEQSVPEYSTESGFSVIPKEPPATPTQPFQSENFKPPEDKVPSEPPKQPQPLKPGESKEFIVNDDAYVLLMAEDNNEIYLKNGDPIEKSEYAKAVSLL